MGVIQLQLRLDGRINPIIVNTNTTVRQLYDIVREKDPRLKDACFYMISDCDYGVMLLIEQSSDTIESIGLRHLAMLDVCIRVAECSLCISCSRLQPLLGYIEVTTSPCDVSFDEDPSIHRAKMPCGCVIGPEAMKSYCDTIINDGNFVFSCPSCDRSWRVLWVRHVLSAILTEDEFKTFNLKLNDNFIAKEPKIQQCPKCKTFLERDQSKKFINPNWVQCPICTADEGRRVEFCWVCLKPWIGNNSSCGNTDCTGTDPRIHHLQTCDTKTIGKVSGVPSVRCCVKCGTLINHKDQCKHMACKCGYAFCFICLKPKTINTVTCEWQCGEAYSVCEVAPRQKHLFESAP